MHDSEESKHFIGFQCSWHCAYLLCSAFSCHGRWFCCLSFSGCFLQLFLEAPQKQLLSRGYLLLPVRLFPELFSVTSSFPWTFPMRFSTSISMIISSRKRTYPTGFLVANTIVIRNITFIVKITIKKSLRKYYDKKKSTSIATAIRVKNFIEILTKMLIVMKEFNNPSSPKSQTSFGSSTKSQTSEQFSAVGLCSFFQES